MYIPRDFSESNIILMEIESYQRQIRDVTNTGNGERGTGNVEPGTGVWKQVYSGNPLESSKWRSRQKKRLEQKQFGLR